MAKRERSFQLMLGEWIVPREAGPARERKETGFEVKEGAMVYSRRGRRGVATEPIEVRPLAKEVKGYSGWVTEETTTLYFDGITWVMWSGSEIGVPRKQVRKRKKE